MENWIQELYEKTTRKIEAEFERMGEKIPYITEGGRYQTDYGEKDIYWWTNGFWCGILWKMYHATGEEKYRKRAEAVERRLDKALYGFTGLHHDTGFMWLHSAVANYRLTGNQEARAKGLLAASILAGRYNPAGKFIRAWNPECVEEGEDCTGWIIVDSMMNIPLLYWASSELNDPRFYYIAKFHADTVMKTLVRPDGSSGHTACLDPDPGELLEIRGGQGYGADSCWSRGLSWILYGFALSYRYTKDQAYLDTAKRAAHYFISQCAVTGYVPPCDFRQPENPPYTDASAGLCAACGLLELSGHVKGREGEIFREQAGLLVRSIAGHCGCWDLDKDSIIQGCKVDYHGGDKQTDLIYADYFLLEAQMRMMGNDFLIW